MKRRAGYSAAELMVVVAIMGIIAGTGPVLMINLQNFFINTTARNDIQRDIRHSIDIIHRMLRQGKLSTIVIDTPAGQGPYSRVQLTLVDERACAFRQTGKKLIMTLAGTETVLSKNLAYIGFTFPRSDDPSIMSVSLTMSKDIQLGKKKVLELSVQKVRVMNP